MLETDEIDVRKIGEDGTEQQISRNGGSEPRWSRSGSEIFFRSGHQMLAVPVELRPVFEAGDPVVLFEEQ